MMPAGLPARFARAAVAPQWEGAPADLAAALREAAAAGEVVKDEEETLLVRAPLPGGGAAWWKLYRVPPRRRLLASLVRSRARREWHALRAIARAGLRAAEVLACAEERRAGLLRSSLLLTRDVAEGRDLGHLLADRLQRRPLLCAAGAAARALHDAGFGHFRLQLRNLLAAADGRIVFLDAPFACAFPAPAPPCIRKVDLVDLAGAGSGLDDGDAAAVLEGYAPDGDPPLSLDALRRRPPLRQKLLRIGLYLFYNNTGHRPAGGEPLVP